MKGSSKSPTNPTFGHVGQTKCLHFRQGAKLKNPQVLLVGFVDETNIILHNFHFFKNTTQKKLQNMIQLRKAESN